MAMTRGGTRATRVMLTALGLVLALGIAVLVVVLGASWSPRFDVTSTGRLALSPRTRAVLDQIDAGTEVVLAADLSGRTRSRQDIRRVLDMLDEIERASDGLRVSRIDTSSSSGIAEFESLVLRLTERDGVAMEAAEARIGGALDALLASGAGMVSMAGGVEDLRGLVDRERAGELARRASLLRTTAEQIGPMAESTQGLLERRIAGERVPDLPAARSLLTRSSDSIRTLLRVLADQLVQLSGDESLSAEAGARAAALAGQATSLVEALGASSAAIESEPLPDVARVIGALESSEAMLVLGPPGGGVGAVSMDDLFPRVAPGAPGADPGRRAETLVTNAIALLGVSDRPMVVVTHAGTSRILTAQADGPLSAMRRRSGLRGIDWIEWPVAMDTDRPGAIAAAEADGRPVVYVVIGVDTSAAGGAERAVRAATVLGSLLESGERVMVNLAPSTLPGLGEPDPMAEAVELLGLRADTGRPVLRERRQGQQRLVDWELGIVAERGEGVLAESVRGLGTLVPWATVIERDDDDAGVAQALLRVSADGPAWREGEWLGYWVTPAQQRPLLIEKPVPNGTRDADPGAGVIAWGVERADSARAMVVGSHIWLFDQFADRPAVIDGRLVQQSPGNAELFLAGVEWLAGNDDLLGRSASALATPVVQPVDASKLRLLRWLLLAGLPAGVLLVGVGVRVVLG